MTKLYYVHDPMCSWCFGFNRTWQTLKESLPESIAVIRILGGLAPDTEQPMPEAMQQQLTATWQRVEQHIPGVKFNFDLFKQPGLRRTTYIACRAVIAARKQGAQYDECMTEAIQHAFYQEARNPVLLSTLLALAAESGLDVDRFKQDLLDPNTQQALLSEIKFSREMGVDSFPSLVLEHEGVKWPIALDYNNATSMKVVIDDIVTS